MALSEGQQTRIAYLVRKGETFEKQIGNLQTYLDAPLADPINANLRLSNLTSLYKDYIKYNDELTSLQADHPRLDAFYDIESRYYDVATEVNKIQRGDQNLNLSTNNITITERHNMPRLPTIAIPKFDGTRDKWLIYKNKFLALVDSRTDISNLVKHAQLESSLSGPALSKIAEFPASEENYPRAWQALIDSYDQKRIMVSEHLDAIIDLPLIPKATATELSSLIDTARQHASMLEQLEVQSIDQLILRHIERCLPPGTRSRWEERLDMNTLPTLDELYKFIQATVFKLHSLERSSVAVRGTGRKRTGDNLDRSQTKNVKSNARSFVTSSSYSCPKCGEAHQLFKCPSFDQMKIQERWNFIKSNKLCRNCLSLHPFPCKSDKRCKKCERDHHTLLHSDKKPRPSKEISKDARPSTSASPQA